MYTIDANVFARLLDARQPENRICQDLIAWCVTNSISVVTPMIMLPEVASAVRRMTQDPMRARIFIDTIRELSVLTLLPLDTVLIQSAADIAADYGLRGMDAIYAAVARQYGYIFVTLDQEALRRAAAIVTTMTPAQALLAAA